MLMRTKRPKKGSNQVFITADANSIRCRFVARLQGCNILGYLGLKQYAFRQIRITSAAARAIISAG